LFSLQAQKEAPLTIAERMPSFPGGDNALSEYFPKNLVYPPIEKEYGIQGVVYVTFVVEKDGSISDVKCLRGAKGAPGLDKEAMRLIASMPNWIPGSQNGKTVRIQYNLPVKFSLGKKKEFTEKEYKEIAKNHYKRGMAFMEGKSFKEALAEFEYTVFYLPSDINTIYQQGIAYHELKQDKSACDEWNKIKFQGSNLADEMMSKYCK
jgi:TonB family protein